MADLATLHLGASSFVATSCTFEGRVLQFQRNIVPPHDRKVQTYESLLAEVRDGYQWLLKQSNSDLSDLVLTTPVPIAWRQGVAGLAPGLKAIQDRPLKRDVADMLERLTGKRPNVFVENDANAAALRSIERGTGKSTSLLVHMRLSTGLGGAIMLNGEPFPGAKGLAGEVGHVTLQPYGIRCGCGNKGCAETLIGGSALLAAIKRSSVRNHVFSHFLDAIELANNGDQIVIAELETMGKYLGQLSASIANILNPGVITFSGPLFDSRFTLLRAAESEFKKRVCAGLECPLQHETFAEASHALSGLAVYNYQIRNAG